MKKIILAGFGQPIFDLIKSLKCNFEILGVIPDYNRQSKYPEFYVELKNLNIPILKFGEVGSLKAEAILVINYNRIIELELIKNVSYILNIHMGLLPVYRGNFANAWSILNGELTVGYSVHAVSEILDAGDIYYTFKYEIKVGETYLNAKNAIKRDIDENLPEKLLQILNGQINGVSQEGECFIYASKLYPEDGVINWGLKTKDILNKYIVFAKPLGTGLKFEFKNRLVEINKLSEIKFIKPSKGINGAVIFKTSSGSIWVKTQDTAISIDEIILDGETFVPSSLFKIGERL